jgi:phosphatidate cytidylyltransferase
MPKGELASRLTVAAIGIPMAVMIIYWGGWYLGILMAMAAGLSAGEYYSLAAARGSQPLRWVGIPLAILLPVFATAHPTYHDFAQVAFTLVLVATLLAVALVLWMRWPEGQPLTAAATTVGGAIYTGGTLSFWILLRALPEQSSAAATAFDGAVLLIFPIWVTWLGDSFAYGFGTRFGKSKLIPTVSPKKTVLGSLGGLGGAVAVGALYSWLWLSNVPLFGLSLIGAAGVSALIAPVGQVGDLAESVIKREAGVKDSSNLLPGHGGALDRLDALYFTVPFTYALLIVIQHWS